MIIDLSNPQPLFKEKKILLSSKFLEYFNIYLEHLYESNNFSKEALLLPTLYTNTYVSSIFHDLKDLYTLKHLINEGLKLDKIITSNYYLCDAIKSDKFFQNINVEYKKNHYLSKAIKVVKYFFFLFFVYIYSKFLPKNHLSLKKGKLIFLEIFLSKRPKNINDCISHYYPNILQNLSKDERDQIVLFPSFYNINSMSVVKTFAKVIKESKMNSYFSESHISIKKLFGPYIAAKKSVKDFKNIPTFLNMNLDGLLIDASNNSIYTRSSFYTFLRFSDLNNNKFTNNHKFICWNENHGPDRAINLAFDKKDSPEVVGHQGLMPSFLKNSYIPKNYEIKRNLWPNEVHTLFKLNISIPDINFKQAPAFRYADFFHRIKNYKKRNQIFIGLNLNDSEAMELLSLVIHLQKKIKGKFIIRPHPLTLKSTLEYISKKLSFAVISEGDYKKDLAESRIFLSHGDTSLYLQSFFGGTVAINSSLDYIDDSFLLNNTPYYKHTNCVEDISKINDSPIIIDDEVIDLYLNKFKEPTLMNIKSFLFN